VNTTLEERLREDPDDWATWRVYADWLLDQGDVRGELIPWEHQLATATLSERERAGLQRQVDVLQEAHEEQWLEGWVPPDGTGVEWRGGFLRGVSLSRILEPLPVVLDLLERPVARFLSRLSPGTHPLEPQQVEVLARSERLRWLRSLNLRGCLHRGAGLCELGRSATLRALTSLGLGYNALGHEGLAATAELAHLPSLCSLALESNYLGRADTRTWASLPAFAELELGGNQLGDGGLGALVDSGACRSLTQMVLPNNDLSAASVRALASTPLQGLDLSHNRLGDAGARILAETQGSLQRLKLKYANLRAEGARALGQLRGLLSLDLTRNRLSHHGARALADSPLASSLTSLKLECTHLGDLGARAIAHSPWSALTHLELSHNAIGDEGARALAAAPGLAGLTHLNLADNQISDEGALELGRSTTLRSLRSLQLARNLITEAGARVLAERFPDSLRLD
jgi:uncharacterized protein (TIGR02996 family)